MEIYFQRASYCRRRWGELAISTFLPLPGVWVIFISPAGAARGYRIVVRHGLFRLLADLLDKRYFVPITHEE